MYSFIILFVVFSPKKMSVVNLDCLNLIFECFDGHKEMLSFLSTNKSYHQLKKNIKFNKCFILYKPSLEKLDYFKNIKCNAIVQNKSSLKRLPKNVISIRYISHELLDVGDIHKETKMISLGEFNQKIKPGVIPNGVSHVTFGFNYNQPLEPGIIPSTVTHVIFVFQFNKKLKIGDIPFGVTHLTMSHCYNQTFEKDVLPESLVHLNVGPFFINNRIKGYIPSSVISGNIINHL